MLFGQFTNFHASALAWALIIFPPMVLVNFTRTLQRIAILNTVGNVFMFGAYGIIFYVSFWSFGNSLSLIEK